MRWWSGFALLLTGLLAGLMLYSFTHRPPSTGVTLLLAHEFDPETIPDFPVLDLGDDRLIVLRVKADALYINQNQVGLLELPSLMKEIMKPRYRKFLFVIGEPDAEYQRFAEAVSAAHSAVPDMPIILITEKEERSEKFNRVRLPGDPLGRYIVMPALIHPVRVDETPPHWVSRTPWHFVDECRSVEETPRPGDQAAPPLEEPCK